MSVKKQYRLLKDLPQNVKAGEVFTWCDKIGEYVQDRFCKEIEADGSPGTSYHFCYNVVEYESDWFEPITPQQETQDGFVWTDELVEEFAKEYRFASSRITPQQFKSSKQQPNPPKEERIEVTDLHEFDRGVSFVSSPTNRFQYFFYTEKDIPIPKEKHPLIKKAIEQIINSKQ